MTTDSLRDLQRTRIQLLTEVTTFDQFRPGTLIERYRKCGKASCHCASDDRHAHGPCWSLTFPVEGKTVTRVIPAGPGVERTQQQIAEYRRFREWVARFTEVNLRVCDEELAQAKATPDAGAAKKGGIAQELLAQVIAEIEQLIGAPLPERFDFEALEMAARRVSLKLAATAIESKLNADHTDHTGAWLVCACGKPARYAGRRDKPLVTVLGPITLSRAYYYCATCEAGFCPRDRSMGIEATDISPAVTRMVGIVGAMMSFEKGAEILLELAAIELCTKHVERAAETLGAEIAADERAHVQRDSETAPEVTMYCGIDGTGIPMRASELVDRAGKQPDGSAKTREVKLCAIFTAEARDKNGKPVRDKGSATYSAAIESAANTDKAEVPSEFAQRVLREARRRGFDLARRQAVIGDGALWIWALADMEFPNAIQIVDIFHAKEHLSKLAKTLHGADAKRCDEWAEQRHRELDDGRMDDLLQALDQHVHANNDAKKCRAYFWRNRHRMRYPEFRAAGLCVSTGVVEAACKTVVGERLKCSGMHWTVRGANAIAALRCSRLSQQRFSDFWDRRAAA